AWVPLARLAASRSLFASSEWSLAFSRSAASLAARSAVGIGVGAVDAEARWREQALLNAAIDKREIERNVLLRMSPVTVKILSLDDHANKLATGRTEKNSYS